MTKITDFKFEYKGKGGYIVIYTSSITNKQWKAYITDMRLIDKTKNADSPTQNNLNQLKKICKS